MNKCAKFHKDSQSGKKLNSISRERLNFRRRPFLSTTLYKNLMQASNFGGTFDQLFLWIFLWNFHRRCLSIFLYHGAKKVKNDQKLKSRGSCLNLIHFFSMGRTILDWAGFDHLSWVFDHSSRGSRHLRESEQRGRNIFGNGKCELIANFSARMVTI